MDRRLVGVIGSGLIGRDPFDRRSWSTISYFLFTELQRQGMLHRAFGVELPQVQRYFRMVANFHPSRPAWRMRFYMSPEYRHALTKEVHKQIEPRDFDHNFLQIGAMYDVPSIVKGGPRCFSYHDGNLTESLLSPYCPRGLGARRIDAALAFEQQVYQGMDIIFTMSEYLRRSFIHNYSLPPERVVNIGAGINLDSIPTYFPHKNYDSQDILFIGVEFERKGGPELLRAFRKVRDTFPRATLHIVGPSRLDIPSDLQRGINFHGYLAKTNATQARTLRELFNRCTIFVMPSRYEPFGIAPLEALVHQIPCLVTNRWALSEMVIPGENGELVECGDHEDIAEKLTALLGDTERLRRLGENGRRMVLDRYTWDKVVTRLASHMQDAEKGA